MHKRLFLNAGHMVGVDSGATFGEYSEAQITLDICTDLERYLTMAGYTIDMLQSDNLDGDSPNYPDICATANDYLDTTDGWALSLHLNSAAQSADGTEFLIYGDDFDFESRDIANILFNVWHVVNIATFCDAFVARGVKERPRLAFLREINNPSVLMEVGFINSPHDLDILVNHRARVVYALFLAIVAVDHGGELSDIDDAEANVARELLSRALSDLHL